MEVDGRIWVIDFGDAKKRGNTPNAYLDAIFKKGKITKWNPEFA